MEPLLNSLNPNQKEAALCTDEHVRIIAGAGSGKTRVLMARIEYLLNDLGVYPSRILAITFTNKAAAEMRTRLQNQCPQDAKNVRISTIHALCVRILREDASAVDYPKNFTIVDPDDQRTILRKSYKLHNLSPKDLSPAKALGQISHWKYQGLAPDEALQRAQGWENLHIALVYQDYYNALKDMKAMDFDDLLLKTDMLLKTDRTVREKWQNRLDYLHVDEFQDVDPIQYDIIKNLTRPDAILCVVGDPDQTIYTWRNASVDIIMNFEKDFQPCKTVILDENYRSTKTILDASNELISHNRNRVKKDLFTSKPDADPIVFQECMDDETEGMRIAKLLEEEHRKHKLAWKDMAVLYRSNYQSRAIEKGLRLYQIPYRIIGGLRFYERKEVKDILAYLKLLTPPTQDDPRQKSLDLAVERVINVPRRGIGEKSLDDIRAEASQRDVNMLEVMRNPQTLKPATAKKAKKFVDLVDELREDLNNIEDVEDLPDLIDIITDKTGYEAMLEKEEDGETRAENIQEIKNDIEAALLDDENLTLSDYLQQVTLLTEKSQMDDTQDLVTLMTVHAAKGTEYPVVMISGLNEDVFPSRRAVDEGGNAAKEEERRLLYVAMTRAKERLYILWNRGFSYQAGRDKLPSSFLMEIPEESQSQKEEREKKEQETKNHFQNPDFLKEARTLAARRKKTKLPAKLRPGAIVDHAKFGQGVVLEEKGNVVVVQFDAAVGKKSIMKSYLTLAKQE